jgi:hypothetical protein
MNRGDHMSYQAIPNLIAHEIQVTEGIELSQKSRFHIERLYMEGLRKENEELFKQKEYWRKLVKY